MLDFNKLLPNLKDLSSKASNSIMEIYNSDFSHKNKDDGSIELVLTKWEN